MTATISVEAPGAFPEEITRLATQFVDGPWSWDVVLAHGPLDEPSLHRFVDASGNLALAAQLVGQIELPAQHQEAGSVEPACAPS